MILQPIVSTLVFRDDINVACESGVRCGLLWNVMRDWPRGDSSPAVSCPAQYLFRTAEYRAKHTSIIQFDNRSPHVVTSTVHHGSSMHVESRTGGTAEERVSREIVIVIQHRYHNVVLLSQLSCSR